MCPILSFIKYQAMRLASCIAILTQLNSLGFLDKKKELALTFDDPKGELSLAKIITSVGVFFFFTAITASGVFGKISESMRVPDFMNASFSLFVGEECPIDQEQAMSAAVSQFAESNIRIDPLKLFKFQNGGLVMIIECSGYDAGAFDFRVNVDWMWYEDGSLFERRLSDQTGSGDAEKILAQVQISLSHALKKYRKENLDLIK